MKKILMMVAVTLMTAMSAMAQRIEVVDADGNGIPLVSVTTEDGVFVGKTDLNGVLADVKGAQKVGLSHVAYKPQLVTVGSLAGGRVTMEDADFGLDEIVVKPKPFIIMEYYFRGFRYIGDSLRAYGAGIMPVAYDIKKNYEPKTRYMAASGTFANKATTWHSAEIELKAKEMCKRNKGAMTDKWVMRDKVKEVYGLSVTKDGDNRWRVENPKGKVGQIMHNGGRSYATLDAARMQRYQDEKQGNKSLMKRREEKDYAYEYATIYRLPSDEDGDTPDLARLMMAMHHWEHNSGKGRERDIYYSYVVTHSYADEAEFKARCKELNKGHQSDMTLEELQAYERQHNIPALSASQLKAIQALKKHY
ncbi:MAG: hypothetical protein II822_03675 [Prevotella sp.]|nr:hypothetical protein [Prevotella sp.]